MNRRHVIGATLALASMVSPASAKEMGAGDLALIMIQLVGLKLISPVLPAAWDPLAQRPLPEAPKDTGECRVLRKLPGASIGAPMHISEPGKYCLDQDYAFNCTNATHSCTGAMIEIFASDVDLDLRGHTLRMSGSRRYRAVKGRGLHIRVHNGSIEGAGVGVMLMNQGRSPGPAYPDTAVWTGDVFADTGFVVENMQFRGVLSAVEVAGRGSQVRDNRIDAILDAETSGGPPLAVLSYGPAARIERNTVRLRELSPGWAGYAIYLRSAQGTVVADNTVSVDGAAGGTIGVGLSNSTGVVLERNRIDTEKITALDQRSGLR